MRIYVIGDRNQELENLNSGRNEVIYTSIFSAIFTTLFNIIIYFDVAKVSYICRFKRLFLCKNYSKLKKCI